MNQQLAQPLTYLAQVRQRRTSALIFPLQNAHITHLILRMKLRAKYGMSYREIVTTGIAHAAVLGVQNRSMVASWRVVAALRRVDLYSFLQSLAPDGLWG